MATSKQTKGDQFGGFNWQDDPGVTTFADRSVRHQGRIACRLEPGKIVKGKTSPNVRLESGHQAAAPDAGGTGSRAGRRPETSGPTGSFRLLALGAGPGGRQLTFHEGGLEPTHDWKRLEVVFNSLDQRESQPLCLASGARERARMWVDDLAVEELALVNVLRREGCPLISSSRVDGKALSYEEGRDFEPVADPKLGSSAVKEGEAQFDHAGATDHDHVPSRIKNGDCLRVGWYHPVHHARLSGHVLS